MLENPELFDDVENVLNDQGIIPRFEKENGPILGRMMITLTEIPEDLDLNLEQYEGLYAFKCTFDFYDCALGLVLDTKDMKPASPIWITPQVDDAVQPDEVWIEFFVQTLAENMSGSAGFGIPMYTFVNDHDSFTVVPTVEE